MSACKHVEPVHAPKPRRSALDHDAQDAQDYVGMIGTRTKRATFTRYAANEGVDARSLVFPIGASFPRDKRPEVIAAFAAAEIQTRMIERAHQGGSGAAGDRSGLLEIGP